MKHDFQNQIRIHRLLWASIFEKMEIMYLDSKVFQKDHLIGQQMNGVFMKFTELNSKLVQTLVETIHILDTTWKVPRFTELRKSSPNKSMLLQLFIRSLQKEPLNAYIVRRLISIMRIKESKVYLDYDCCWSLHVSCWVLYEFMMQS